MSSASIPIESISTLAGFSLHDGDAVSGWVQNGKLELSVLSANAISELEQSLDECLNEEPIPITPEFWNRMRALASGAPAS